MQNTLTNAPDAHSGLRGFVRVHGTLIVTVILLLLLPFIVALLDGQSFAEVFANETGNSKFVQGLMIEIFILAIYAISYDLILGITGLLSFGHAMFFAVGAYFTGIAFKTLEWGLVPTLIGLVVLGILQALLFGLVLPRVQGVTFALVTLGIASVFAIVVQSNEVVEFTGADVGLQGVVPPDFLNTNSERFRLYVITLIVTAIVYLIYRRFVDSPTGRVCVASRENEERAKMLGYNTFHFKLVALMISSVTAALAGFFHTIHQPIVSPNVASLAWTVVALLIILIGGVGTLSGALIGAAVYRLLEFFLDRYFGEAATFLLGVMYILLVLFVPFGIVGTWRARKLDIDNGRKRLMRLIRGSGKG